MQFGFCGDPSLTTLARQAGYDFAEWTVGELLKPREPEVGFEQRLEAIRAAALPYPVANCFVPADLKITGPQADLGTLEGYVRVVFARARVAGLQAIVFGSGGARAIPEGFSRETAWEQLVAFTNMIAPMAAAHAVTVVVEPLNRAECNVLNTVAECARLVRQVDHPGVRLLVDAYHLMRDGDSLADVVRHAELVKHVHIATVPNRLPPGVERCDLAAFFAALRDGGYDGRVSIEARFNDPAAELPRALSVLKNLAPS